MTLRRFINTFCQLNLNISNEKIPIFNICSSNVFIIKSPSEFYNTLKILAKNSTKRISISSLYIGTSHLEKDLISCFSEAKTKCENLDLTILLDYNRSTRTTRENDIKTVSSSKSILLPLVEQGANVNFYLTPKLSGLRQFIQRTPQWNELTSLHHMKLYIFDDNLVISGANLSDLYFTNRQDRYVLIRNSSQICDYFDELIKTISKFSLSLQQNGNFSLHSGWKYDPRKYFHQSMFEVTAKKRIMQLNDKFYHDNNFNNLENCETIVFPLLQMKSIGINDEEKFTTSLIENCPENSQFNMATGYFNLTSAYQKIMLNRHNKYSIWLLMASEEANGFFNGKGILQYIPLVYTHYVRNFLKNISDSKISLFYYCRPSWSFHGKGIWLSSHDFFLTIIGSTNFGYRSVYRDNEAQIVLLTKNEKLKLSFCNEFQNFVDNSRQIEDEIEHLPKVSFWIRCVANIFRSYF